MDRAAFIGTARIYVEQINEAVAAIEKTIKTYEADGGAAAFADTVVYGNGAPTPTEFHDGLVALGEVAAFYNDPARLAKIVRIKQ